MDHIPGFKADDLIHRIHDHTGAEEGDQSADADLAAQRIADHRHRQTQQNIHRADTQPGQALYSFIPDWFKPIAYALILLRKDGIPCVFYGDYYGIPHDNVAPVEGLKKLLKLRECYAYGDQKEYFDDSSLVGFTRSGDEEHENSGLAVLLTDSVAGTKRMVVDKKFVGCKFYDAMGHFTEPVVIDGEGAGEFKADGGSVAVWVPETVYQKLWCEVE